jgi:hypothetical protein
MLTSTEAKDFTHSFRALHVATFGREILLPAIREGLTRSPLFHQRIMGRHDVRDCGEVMEKLLDVKKIRGEDLGALVRGANNFLSGGFPDDSENIYAYRRELCLSRDSGLWCISGNGSLWLFYRSLPNETHVTLSNSPTPGISGSHHVGYRTRPGIARVWLGDPQSNEELIASLDKREPKVINLVYGSLCDYFSKTAE